MNKKRPYLDEKVVNEAVKIWKEEHRLNSGTNIPESSILEDIIKDWVKTKKKGGK